MLVASTVWVPLKGDAEPGDRLVRVAPPDRRSIARTRPRLGETLTRVLLLGSENTTEAARRHADLLIKPRAEGVGLLEFHQLDTAREAGRAAAREALEQAPAGWFA
jgi:predicted acylesterase/phospholipase RssA